MRKIFFLESLNPENQYQDEWFATTKSKTTIKSASPFTQDYLDIENHLRDDLLTTGEQNLLFNLEYIKFLQSNFMPYAFIWAGFIYREMDKQEKVTRLTQGCIEKFFGTTKRIRGQPIVPARHVIESMKSAIAGCAIAKSVLKDVDILGKISFFKKFKCLIVIFF